MKGETKFDQTLKAIIAARSYATQQKKSNFVLFFLHSYLLFLVLLDARSRASSLQITEQTFNPKVYLTC